MMCYDKTSTGTIYFPDGRLDFKSARRFTKMFALLVSFIPERCHVYKLQLDYFYV